MEAEFGPVQADASGRVAEPQRRSAAGATSGIRLFLGSRGGFIRRETLPKESGHPRRKLPEHPVNISTYIDDTSRSRSDAWGAHQFSQATER